MADTKISALPASTVPLAGTEVLPIVQSSTTKQVSVANLTAGRAISALSVTSSTIGSTTSANLSLLSNNTVNATLDTSGNFLVGTATTITSGKSVVSFNGATFNGLVLSESANASNSTYLAFNNGASVIGSVSRVGATAAVIYNTTSDQRLKSNIENATPVLNTLMQVQVRQFDWTEGDLHQDYGFIAQELQPVLSGVVTKGKTEEDVWQLDYSRLTPHLVKAIQEQQVLINALTDRIAALEAK